MIKGIFQQVIEMYSEWYKEKYGKYPPILIEDIFGDDR